MYIYFHSSLVGYLENRLKPAVGVCVPIPLCYSTNQQKYNYLLKISKIGLLISVENPSAAMAHTRQEGDYTFNV